MRRLASFLFVLPFGLCAQQTSVLFIGNSYTYVNDLPNTMRLLALSLGDTVMVSSSAPGGYTLFQHSTYAPTITALESQDWDFVVMQEQSQLGALPTDVTTTELGATQLVARIEENHECTYPVFYMTWGRQNGDAQNCASFPFMCTYDGMQQGLRDNYVALAEGNDGYTAPVGAAWKQVRDTHPLINLYDPDGSHPSAAGTYLAACVFYCTLFQESCVASPYAASLQPDTAAILRDIASAVVLGEPLIWNLDVPNGTSALLDGATVGPDWITLVHNGQGTHLWTCTNGQSFTTATVTFTFPTSDTYYVTHTYNDPCGNSDTVTLTFNIVVGVEELGNARVVSVRSLQPSVIEVVGVSGELTLTDLQGRAVLTRRLNADRTLVECQPGLYLYRIVEPSGTMWTGKVLVD